MAVQNVSGMMGTLPESIQMPDSIPLSTHPPSGQLPYDSQTFTKPGTLSTATCQANLISGSGLIFSPFLSQFISGIQLQNAAKCHGCPMHLNRPVLCCLIIRTIRNILQTKKRYPLFHGDQSQSVAFHIDHIVDRS